MFRRPEKKEADEISIRNESDAEELSGNIGNEANLRNDLPNNISNEANNKLILDGMRENESYGHGTGSELSDNDRINLLNSLERIPDEEKNQANIIENLDLIGDEEKGASIANLDWIPQDDPDDEEDQATNKAYRRKKKTVPKKEKKAQTAAKKKSRNGLNDLGLSNEDMKPIKGWNFEPEMFPAREGQSGLGRLVSKIAYYSGKTIGKVLGFLGNLVVFPLGAYALGRRVKNWWDNRSGLQKKRDFKSIPGWDGAKWEKEPKDPNELDIDFRRVPEVWSYPIAAEAEKEPDKPRDPIISVYISQVEPGEYTQTNDDGSTGHSGIGIEFSRYSQIHQKWERYNLRYGFFLQGGLPDISTDAVLGFHQATVPGQLMNEKGHEYDISRSYPVKNRQVNAVLKASQKYADKGYNNYTRNCTTFVREMMVNYAGIPGAGSIFTQDDIEFSKKHDRQMFGASIFTLQSQASFGSGMTKLTHGNDYNYTGFGNKRATQEDYDRYRNSMTYFKSAPGKADIPSVDAENMRRDTRWKTGGRIGSMPLKNSLMDDAQEKLPQLGLNIMQKLLEITPEGQLNGQIPGELKDIIVLLGDLGRPLKDFEPKLFNEDELRHYRTELSDLIDKMHLLLYKYYKNDRRIHFDVMKVIELATSAINDADERYNQYLQDNEIGGGDLGTLRNDMMNKKQTFSTADGTASVELTPSMLEGWIQIYKTPEAAIRAAARFHELGSKRLDTEAKEKEFNKMERMNQLAQDFSSSHRYMLEKGEFSRQDMDYAFALEKKERKGLSNEIIAGSKTSGAVYQSLILEEVFKGMKERVSAFMAENHIEEGRNENALAEWLDEDMAGRIRDKAKTMTEIAGALSRALTEGEQAPDREDLLDELLDLIKKKWISRLFTGVPQENKGEGDIDTSEKGHAEDPRDALLRSAFDRVAEGGRTTQQLDACLLRAMQ